MIPKWKPNSMFTIADSSSIITKHTQTMACAHRWRGRHCFWTPTTDPRGKTPPATPLYERTMDRSDCRYIVRLHLVQCVGVTKPRARISASMTFSRSNPSELPMVSRVCSFHKTFPTGTIRSKKLISGRFLVQRSEGNRLNSQSDDPGTGNFPRMGGGVSKTSFLKSGFHILSLYKPYAYRSLITE